MARIEASGEYATCSIDGALSSGDTKLDTRVQAGNWLRSKMFTPPSSLLTASVSATGENAVASGPPGCRWSYVSTQVEVVPGAWVAATSTSPSANATRLPRSEERRVGKEGRS